MGPENFLSVPLFPPTMVDSLFAGAFGALTSEQKATLEAAECNSAKIIGNLEQDELEGLLGEWSEALQHLHNISIQIVNGAVKACSIIGLPDVPKEPLPQVRMPVALSKTTAGRCKFTMKSIAMFLLHVLLAT